MQLKKAKNLAKVFGLPWVITDVVAHSISTIFTKSWHNSFENRITLTYRMTLNDFTHSLDGVFDAEKFVVSFDSIDLKQYGLRIIRLKIFLNVHRMQQISTKGKSNHAINFLFYCFAFYFLSPSNTQRFPFLIFFLDCNSCFFVSVLFVRSDGFTVNLFPERR
jgi:hypothetical protein